MSELKQKAIDIANRYIGKVPDEFGCVNWSSVKELLVKEIMGLVSMNNKKQIAVIGSNESFLMESLSRDFTLLTPSLKMESKITDFTLPKTYSPEELLKIDTIYKGDEVKGKRGITNNRKTKSRKKSKNGNRKKK
jgi:hypothetical protein